jgi:UDP-GlcNAc3NAcA epimerase
VDEVVIHTGQHYDENMSGSFFKELEIREPDHHLGIGSGLHGAQTGRMLEAIEEVLLQRCPDWVLVYGDTNSTLAGALAASKLRMPLAHVEAGLRSFNKRMPEELNRVLTDHAADLLFAPTQAAVENLRREGIPVSKVKFVGDVMYDAALQYGDRAESTSGVLDRLGVESRRYILATVHRAENTDDPERLRAIFDGLGRVAKDVPVVLPLHPRTRNALEAASMFAEASDTIYLTEPAGYLDMLMLEKHARLIATDSGGVQKEAFFYRVPCVTLREETEWVELVQLGWNRLVRPITVESVEETVRDALNHVGAAPGANPYGDGRSAHKIVRFLSE